MRGGRVNGPWEGACQGARAPVALSDAIASQGSGKGEPCRAPRDPCESCR